MFHAFLKLFFFFLREVKIRRLQPKKNKLHISCSVEVGRNLKSHYFTQNKKLLQQDKNMSKSTFFFFFLSVCERVLPQRHLRRSLGQHILHTHESQLHSMFPSATKAFSFLKNNTSVVRKFLRIKILDHLRKLAHPKSSTGTTLKCTNGIKKS